ncbi:SusD/RagB family nutrient-binding outer membrane lipoprotein [Prevotella sp. SGI.027]
MKLNKYIVIMAFAACTASLQSCFDYDRPEDDFRLSDIELGKEDIIGSAAQANKLNFKAEYTEAQVTAAFDKLENEFRQLGTAVGIMRGGKEGQPPVSHAYQFQYTIPLAYAQYFTVPHYNFAFGSDLYTTYTYSAGWNNAPNSQFIGAKNVLAPMLNTTAIDTIPEMKAFALLLYNYGAIENVDMYGPMAYNDFKGNKLSAPFTYDDVRTIYMETKANLDSIVACFEYFKQKPEWYRERVAGVLYGNTWGMAIFDYNPVDDIEKFRRFANSLKLRMAMHIVKVEPTLAKEWAEEAVASGVIEDAKSQIALRPVEHGKNHPIAEISDSWRDLRLTAAFITLLKSLNHPYLTFPIEDGTNVITKNSGRLVSPDGNVDIAENTEQVGIRAGVEVGVGQDYAGNQFIGYSTVSKLAIEKAPLYLMKWAEVDFLRAEGALRDWNMGGTAKEFYERGIENAHMFDVTSQYAQIYQKSPKMLKAYMQVDKATPVTYVDPSGDTDPIESPTTIGVKWNDGDSQETKLEKIITQKYIALFPEPMEAWVDMRRTGYPKLLPVVNVEESDGSLLFDGDTPRRLHFPNTDDASLLDISKTGLPALGGPDNFATRLWWDKNVPNFQ